MKLIVVLNTCHGRNFYSFYFLEIVFHHPPICVNQVALSWILNPITKTTTTTTTASEKKDRYLDLARELKKSNIEDCNWYTWNNPHRIDQGARRLRNQSRDHLDYNIINIGQNTEKSPGDLRRLAVTQTLVRTHPLTLE